MARNAAIRIPSTQFTHTQPICPANPPTASVLKQFLKCACACAGKKKSSASPVDCVSARMRWQTIENRISGAMRSRNHRIQCAQVQVLCYEPTCSIASTRFMVTHVLCVCVCAMIGFAHLVGAHHKEHCTSHCTRCEWHGQRNDRVSEQRTRHLRSAHITHGICIN